MKWRCGSRDRRIAPSGLIGCLPTPAALYQQSEKGIRRAASALTTWWTAVTAMSSSRDVDVTQPR